MAKYKGIDPLPSNYWISLEDLLNTAKAQKVRSKRAIFCWCVLAGARPGMNQVQTARLIYFIASGINRPWGWARYPGLLP